MPPTHDAPAKTTPTYVITSDTVLLVGAEPDGGWHPPLAPVGRTTSEA